MTQKISVGILGFGGRGMSMAKAIVKFPDEIYVKAIAEPEENRKQMAMDEYGVQKEFVFNDYNEFLSKGVIVDLLIITTMDNYHYEPLMKALEIGYKNILLEKPLSASMKECIEMTEAAEKHNANVIVLHSLRYSLYYRKLKEIVDSGEIGKVMGIRHVEGASLMNYSHSFVRGNWENTRDSAPLIMAKSCHDTDIITYITGKKYKKISSFGTLTYFTKENDLEGSAKRCVDCKYKDECMYSTVPLYSDERHTPWYESIVTKEGYASVEEAAQKGRYGRCVYKCDNNLVDNQVMNFEFEDGTTGTFTVTAFDSGRRTEVQGTLYMMTGDEGTGEIKLRNQIGGNIDKVYNAYSVSSATIDHFSTDMQLTRELIAFINHGDATNLSFIQGALDSHLACFAAEISREEERIVYMKELVGNER